MTEDDILTPEEYMRLVELGGLNASDEAKMGMMKSQAEMLRQRGAMPEMRGNARVQTAANPLEFVGALGNQYMAGKKEKEVEALQGSMGGRTQQQNQMFLSGLLRKKSGAQAGNPFKVSAVPEDEAGGFQTFGVR